MTDFLNLNAAIAILFLLFQYHASQSTESTRLFLQSSELEPPPTSSPAGECVPPFGSGGTHSLGGDGMGGSQFGRGDRLCSTLGIYVCTPMYSVLCILLTVI